jgi:uncharacterized membrane protein
MVIAQDPLSILLWNIGHAFCHQLPDRSLFFSGFQMPVCARDTGTYLGFLIVFAFWAGLRRYRNGSRPDVIVLASAVIAMLPFILDGVASYIGLYSTNNEIRLFSGLLMGAAMGLVLLSIYPLIVGKKANSLKVFSWKDLIPIYIIVLIVGFLIISFDAGTVMFYVLETLTITGILILLFMAIMTAMSFILQSRGHRSMTSGPIFALMVVGLEVGLITILWFLHDAATGLIG